MKKLKWNWNDILYYFHWPNSAWGLRYRASRLPEGNYRTILELLAKALDKDAVTTNEAKAIIACVRAGKMEEAVTTLEERINKTVEEWKQSLRSPETRVKQWAEKQ